MENESVRKEKEIQKLQKRVTELEQQLAEAGAAVSALTSQRKGNAVDQEERFQRALFVSPYPLMIRRDDGKVIMINAAWTEITGYTLADIPTVEDWARKAYGEQSGQQQSLILTKGFSQSGIKKWGEFEVNTRSGEKRIWDFSTAPLGVDESGRELVMTMAVDVTDRKQVEENLRATRDEAVWLARLPGENPNPVARVSTEGIVLYRNPAAAKLPEWRLAAHEPLPLPIRRLVQQALTEGRVVEQDLLLGEKTYAVWIVPIPNEHYANVYGRDITEHKKAEEALKESERRQREITRLLELDQARLAAILRHLPVGVWIVDQQGRLIGSNEQADRIWAGEAPLLNSTAEYQKFVSWHPGSRELLKPEEYPVVAALQTGEPVDPIELQIRRFDGSEGTVLASAAPIKDSRGQLMGVVGVNVDISDRKQMEEALRRSEERFAKAFHITPDAMIISRMSDGLIIEANEGWRKLLGHDPEEVIGRTSLELGIYVNPEDRKEIIARLQKKGFLHDFEVQIRRKSGEIRQASMFVEQLEINRVICLLTVMRDITERKHAEEALRRSEERFRSLADSMPQLVWTALPDGTVDYYNQRYQEYWEIKQVEGAAWEWTPVLHPDDRQPTLQAWKHSVETGESYQIEHRVRMADGSYRWHLSRGVPMLDEQGRVVHWFGTATDIHDLKLAEEELKDYAERLERSNRELEQFAFMASHDLQEPLRKIKMFGDLLEEHATDLNERERSYLERMQSAAGRMRSMVAGLLELSRVATRGQYFVPVDLSQVASEVLSDLESQIRRTGGRVRLGTFPVVEGDPLQLRQLMQNLLGNALKYHKTDLPPEVHVYGNQAYGKAQIFVEDQGIGFEQEDAERIFQPFQRLVGHSQYAGNGIGLAICRRIVERHGGNIAAISKPGHGTTFIITLPIHHPETIKNEPRKDANNEESGAASGR